MRLKPCKINLHGVSIYGCRGSGENLNNRYYISYLSVLYLLLLITENSIFQFIVSLSINIVIIILLLLLLLLTFRRLEYNLFLLLSAKGIMLVQ
jgi:hypothetical protein